MSAKESRTRMLNAQFKLSTRHVNICQELKTHLGGAAGCPLLHGMTWGSHMLFRKCKCRQTNHKHHNAMTRTFKNRCIRYHTADSCYAEVEHAGCAVSLICSLTVQPPYRRKPPSPTQSILALQPYKIGISKQQRQGYDADSKHGGVTRR